MNFLSISPENTKKISKKIASKLKGGEVLGLVGELGSGKTQFVKGLAEYFKISTPITSPTFVLVKPYIIPAYPRCPHQGVRQLIHIDCYRLDNPEELLAIGLNEFIKDKKNIVIIEWADKIESILPKNTKWIEFKLGKKENERTINIP